MTTSPSDLTQFDLSYCFHRNTSRWAHNAVESSDTDDVPEPGSEHPERLFTALPRPEKLETAFDELIKKRCSCRDFSGDSIHLKDLATTLYYGYGVGGTDHWGVTEFLERPVPSGGGMYPLELYAITRGVTGLDNGVYHYVPLLHGLEQIRDLTIPDTLIRYLFMGQYPVLKAAAIILISGVPARSMKKYGDRGYRYMLFEAGHVAQNINLAAPVLGAETLNLGGFFDDEIGKMCGFIRDTEIALYAIAVGKGVATSKHRLRFSDDEK